MKPPPRSTRERLVPHLVVDGVQELDPVLLLEMGRTCVLVDLDNTLLAWGSRRLDPAASQWVAHARQAGLRVCVLSNSRSNRVAEYAAALDVPYVAFALKPRRAAARAAMALLGATQQSTVIIGDQIFTDILLGHRLGIFTILVRPLALREQLWMRLVRRVERRFWPPTGGVT